MNQSSLHDVPLSNLQVTDVARAQIIASQSHWLDDPVTHMFLTALRNRATEYHKRLVDRCQVLTDEKLDIQDRACISTCKAIEKIAIDPELFVKYSTLKAQ